MISPSPHLHRSQIARDDVAEYGRHSATIDLSRRALPNPFELETR